VSRGQLDKETSARIESNLPDVVSLQRTSLELQPDILSAGFPPKSTIPIASVCLQDVTYTLASARYALLEADAHLIWYREKREPPDERAAVFFGQFYADDAALRIYAAGEHLANAIVAMLEIKKELREFIKLKSTKRKNIVSKQANVGTYLIENKPEHEITKAVRKLKESEEWDKTRKYRDAWVHSKPPIIKGTGISYERRNRLIVTDTYIGISGGGGDEPRYSVDDLLEFIRPSLFLFTETVTTVIQYYIELINETHKPFWDHS
jgi:ribosomal protein S13